MCVGQTATYSANSVVSGGGSGAWSSSNTSIATVDASGLVTAKAAGTAAITYTITGGCGGTKSATQNVVVNAPPTGPIDIVGTLSICGGESANLEVIGGSEGSGCSYQWGTGTAIGSNIISGATGSIYTTLPLTSNTDYWVRRIGLAPCSNYTADTKVTVTVIARPSAPVIGTVTQPICTVSKGSVVLSGLPSAGIWTINPVGIKDKGTSLIISDLSQGTYTYTVTSEAGCTSAESAKVVINAPLVVPGSVTVSGGGTQCGGTKTLTATGGANGTIYYQGTTSNGTSTATASSSQTVGSGTYYFRAQSADGCWGTQGSASVTIYAIPTITGTLSVCVGSTTQLAGSGIKNDTTPWQSSDTSIATVNSNGLVTGIKSGSSVITYKDNNGCTQTATVTVKEMPTILSSVDVSVCGSGTAILQAYPSSGATVNWYSTSTGGTSVNTGTDYSINLSASTTYYVDATLNGCTTTSRTAVTATVKKIPTVTVHPVSLCGSGSVTLSASSDFGVIYWYASPTGGDPLRINYDQYTTPVLTTTTTYYASGYYNGCASARIPVTATITNPIPAITNMTATICSGGTFSVTPVNGTNGTVPSGTTYAWEAPGAAGSTSGSGASSISGTITNTTQSLLSVVYNVTPTIGTCPGNPFTVTVTVKPKPGGSDKSLTPICSGEGMSYADNNNPFGTTYSWNLLEINPLGSLDAFLLTTTSNVCGVAKYSLTPTADGCVGNPFNVYVSVCPKPFIANITRTVCAQSFVETPVNGNGNIVPDGTKYSWPLPVAPGITAGLDAGTDATSVFGSLLNGTSSPITVVYNVTAKTPAGCTGTFTISVTVQPIINVGGQSRLVCNGTLFTYNPSLPAGVTATYSWPEPVVTPAGALTGAAASGVFPSSVSGYLVNTTNSRANAQYTVTPFGGCFNSTFIFNATVLPTPKVTIEGTSSVCVGVAASITFTNPTSEDETVTYTLNGTTNTIAIAANGTASVSVPTGTAGTYTYSLVSAKFSTSPECSTSVSGSATVTVNPSPNIHSQTAQICSGEIYSFSPVNGQNGDVVPSGIIYENLGATYYNTIGYTWVSENPASPLQGRFTNSDVVPRTGRWSIKSSVGGCVGPQCDLNLTINPKPAVPTAVITQPTCSVAKGTVVLSGLPSSGTWTINPGSITGSGTSKTITGLAPGTYSFTITNSYLCSSDPLTVVINPGGSDAPTIDYITLPSCTEKYGKICFKNLPTPGSWRIDAGDGGYTSSSGSTGCYPFLVPKTYNFTTVWNGCTSAVTHVEIPCPTGCKPVVKITKVPTCADKTANVSITGLPAGSWTLTGSDNSLDRSGSYSEINYSNLVPGTYTITITDSNGCVWDPMSFTITNPSCGCSFTPVATVDCTTGAVNITGLPTKGWVIKGEKLELQGTASSYSITSLARGKTYSIDITDNDTKCTVTLSVDVPLAECCITSKVVCSGKAAVLTLTMTEKYSTGSYKWVNKKDGKDGGGNISSNVTTISGLSPGTYEFTIDREGCGSVVMTVVVKDCSTGKTGIYIGYDHLPYCKDPHLLAQLSISELPLSGWVIKSKLEGKIIAQNKEVSTCTLSDLGMDTYIIYDFEQKTELLTFPVYPTDGKSFTANQIGSGVVRIDGLTGEECVVTIGRISQTVKSTSAVIEGVTPGSYVISVIKSADGCGPSPYAITVE